MNQPGGEAADEEAPAKINLALHVTGRRNDGYHLLDSLVVFTELGDRISLRPGPSAFNVTGPFAADVPRDADNLCLRAARLAGAARMAITLDKHLPVASGIGGGTADAAAVLRGLLRLGYQVPRDLAALGSDLPVCLTLRPARMRGVGEVLDPLPPLPVLHLVLINPGVPMATPRVFAGLAHRANDPLPPIPDAFADAQALAGYLATCRNDLQAPAQVLVPVLDEVLARLRASGAMLARMSGSGATCFGIYADAAAAQAAADRLARRGWWAKATTTREGAPR